MAALGEEAAWAHDALVLAAAGLVVPLFQYARLGAVVRFLLVGVGVGPYGLGEFAEAMPALRYVAIEKTERVCRSGS